MIPIGKPLLDTEEKQAVLDVLDSGMLAQGKKVQEFENNFADFIGVKHAIATSNGTTGLHAALVAHEIKEGDEVITTAFSFVATGSVIRLVGATPVFVDIDEKTFNIDASLIEDVITPKTKAIMPVHLFGRIAAMDKIIAIAEKHNLVVIEDACQAHGAELNGKKAGSFGTGCFSFYPTKNITTGEGGMVTTNDDNVAAKVREFINHGSVKRYYHASIGSNFRMTDIAAAIGVEQLKKITSFTEKRRKNAAVLRNGLEGIKGIIVPDAEINVSGENKKKNGDDGDKIKEHVFHQYTIRITEDCALNRDQVIEVLTAQGIASSVFYPVPIHKQEAYAEFNHYFLPVTEKLAQEVLSLPVHPGLSEEDLAKITTAFEVCR